MSDLLVEKYRPKVIDDVILDEVTLKKFKSYIESKDIPHLLFHGTAGLGKTTVAKILVKSITDEYLYINASDDNNVETVRTKIKDFCYTIGFGSGLKIVILDEFDGMTEYAMRMLRNTMEEFSNTCRFILTCNYITKVIDPIRSRCQEFEFGKPAMVDIAKRCLKILKEENAECLTEECKADIKKLVKSCYPDIRKTINNLQKFIVNGAFSVEEKVMDSEDAEKFISLMKVGDIKKIRHELLGAGCDYVGLYRILFEKSKLLGKNESAIVGIMLTSAEYMYRHASVPDQEVNFVACLLSTWKLMNSE